MKFGTAGLRKKSNVEYFKFCGKIGAVKLFEGSNAILPYFIKCSCIFVKFHNRKCPPKYFLILSFIKRHSENQTSLKSASEILSVLSTFNVRFG